MFPIFRILLAASLTSLLSGCAVVKDSWSSLTNGFNVYQEPADGPRNRLRLSLSPYGSYRIYPAATCIDHAQPGSGVGLIRMGSIYVPVPSLAHTMEPRDLGTPGMNLEPRFTSRDLWLRSAQPVTVAFATEDAEGEYRYSCQAALSFVPREGADYQVVAAWHGAKLRNAGCGMAIHELTPSGPVLVEAPKAQLCSALPK